MAVVDTFTKLIFGDEGFTAREAAIIEAFRSVNPDVQHDTYPDMGEYLRGLGVSEMIQLVSKLREHMAASGDVHGIPPDQTAPGDAAPSADRTGRNR